jgi:hypothetical protein
VKKRNNDSNSKNMAQINLANMLKPLQTKSMLNLSKQKDGLGPKKFFKNIFRYHQILRSYKKNSCVKETGHEMDWKSTPK